MRTALLLIWTLTRRVTINVLLTLKMNPQCCKLPETC